MPLFMDYHKIENVTVEAVKTAHMADVSVQAEYGVRYLQFWVNEEAGSVFCLVEGPDAATCEKVHKMAHGNVACALTEVNAGMYEKIMGTDHVVDHGYVKKADGTADLGFRNIMFVTIYGITQATGPKDFSMLERPDWARQLVVEDFLNFEGRRLEWEKDDSIVAVFDDATKAVECALSIQRRINEKNNHHSGVIFKIGISAAQPVTASGDFFNEAIRTAHRLSMAVRNNHILASPLVAKICKKEALLTDVSQIKVLSIRDEEFLTRLLDIATSSLTDQNFDLNRLSREIFISRAQLYRRVMAVSGRSPNDLMRDLRMEKAISLLKQRKGNVTEVAYETGFNSPSYFTKCFSEKFGYTPTAFNKTNRE